MSYSVSDNLIFNKFNLNYTYLQNKVKRDQSFGIVQTGFSVKFQDISYLDVKNMQ